MFNRLLDINLDSVYASFYHSNTASNLKRSDDKSKPLFLLDYLDRNCFVMFRDFVFYSQVGKSPFQVSKDEVSNTL